MFLCLTKSAAQAPGFIHGVSGSRFVYLIRLLCNVAMSEYRVRYRSNNNVVFSCKYHVVWCPKYRRDVLVNEADRRLKEIIQRCVWKPIAKYWSGKSCRTMCTCWSRWIRSSVCIA